jgi:hypothetical protein
MMSSFGRENKGAIAEREKSLAGHSILAIYSGRGETRPGASIPRQQLAYLQLPALRTFQRPHSTAASHLHNALKCSPSTFSQSVCLSSCWLPLLALDCLFLIFILQIR